MDNLRCHKVKGVREAIEKAGASLSSEHSNKGAITLTLHDCLAYNPRQPDIFPDEIGPKTALNWPRGTTLSSDCIAK